MFSPEVIERDEIVEANKRAMGVLERAVRKVGAEFQKRNEDEIVQMIE